MLHTSRVAAHAGSLLPAFLLWAAPALALNGSSSTPAPNDCTVPGDIAFVSDDGPCEEGSVIANGGNCTARCLPGYESNEASLDCTDGVLTPATFVCSEKSCPIPYVPYADKVYGACGPQIHDDKLVSGRSICVPSCMEGYVPSQRRMRCDKGVLTPPGFICSKLCRPFCSGLRVVYGQSRGMAALAQALFSHIPCSSFKPWVVEETLARADFLVFSGADIVGQPDGILLDKGLAGVAVFVDGGCAEIALRGQPLPYLAGLEERVLYVGADRISGLIYGESLVMPPGAVSQLATRQGLRSWKDGENDLKVLLAPHRPESTWPPKTKFLVYAVDECHTIAERFFDRIVEEYSHMGKIECLARCCGSHPELIIARPHCGTTYLGWCTDNYRNNLTAILEPYRFALIFEEAANGMFRCSRHVGGVGACLPGAGFPGTRGISLFDALAAGAIPVYRGPDEALAVVDQRAVVYTSGQRLLDEIWMAFKKMLSSPEMERVARSAPALPTKSAQRWFNLSAQMRGEPGELSTEATILAGRLMAGSTHGRCIHWAEGFTPNSEAGHCERGAPFGACIA